MPSPNLLYNIIAYILMQFFYISHPQLSYLYLNCDSFLKQGLAYLYLIVILKNEEAELVKGLQ